MIIGYSMDGVLECPSAEDCKYFCPHQFTHTTLLHLPMNMRSTSSILAHVVSKKFAGIDVLDLLHDGSVTYFDRQGPSTAVKIMTGLGFSALASCSDWIFGGCLVYDLVALAVGQSGIGQKVGKVTWHLCCGNNRYRGHKKLAEVG